MSKLQKQIRSEQEARRKGRKAGQSDYRDRCVRENPYPKGKLADLWIGAYNEAQKGW